jgi:hypothetical protein
MKTVVEIWTVIRSSESPPPALRARGYAMIDHAVQVSRDAVSLLFAAGSVDALHAGHGSSAHPATAETDMAVVARATALYRKAEGYPRTGPAIRWTTPVGLIVQPARPPRARTAVDLPA